MSKYKCVCLDCGKEFILPDNIIEMARTEYCKKCFGIRLKKVVSMPLNKFMQGCANSVLKGGSHE